MTLPVFGRIFEYKQNVTFIIYTKYYGNISYIQIKSVRLFFDGKIIQVFVIFIYIFHHYTINKNIIWIKLCCGTYKNIFIDFI